MNHRLRSALIIASVILVDRLTKLYIQSAFGPYDSVPVIPGIFNIVHVENPGAAFGMLAEAGAWRSWVLIGASAVIMAIIGAMLWRPRPKDAAETILTPIGLALVLGGALGNLWDRALVGTVTDFLQVFIGSYEFPSFNAADSAITIGAGLLILDLWRNRKVGSANPVGGTTK